MSFIPRQAKLERDMLTIRLDRDVHAALQEYTEFLESSRDYVIGETLRVAFAKDREFQQWRTTRVGSEAPAPDEGAEQARGARQRRARRPAAAQVTSTAERASL
jgi:predicted transcriptional regulator